MQTILNKDIHLSLLNQSGSVEHYYHFLLGFLVPLVLTHEKIIQSGRADRIYVRSCSILNTHLKSLRLPEIVVLNNYFHERLKTITWLKNLSGLKLNFVESLGFDDPDHYSYVDFCKAAQLLIALLNDEVAKFAKELKRSNNGHKIILINREAPHSSYLSDSREKKGSGTSRRSIPNFDALHEKIASCYPNTLSTSLEGRPLAYQIALFRHADIIIAQHGAALANLIWCTPGTTIIEIHPADSPKKLLEGHFRNLASCMKMQYLQVEQKHRHSEVEINLVLEALNNIEEFKLA